MWEDGYATSKPVILSMGERDSPRVNDALVASKGAAILRMLESVVGEASLKTSMRVNTSDFKGKLLYRVFLKKATTLILNKKRTASLFFTTDILLERENKAI